MKRILYFFVLCTMCSCANKTAQGYENLDELYQDFPNILKSSDWDEMAHYVERIVPGQSTFDYMKANDFSYRGIPAATDKTPFLDKYIKLFYMNSVARFRIELEKKNHLKDLIYVRREEEGTEMYHEELGIEVTETFIILKSGDKEYRCKLGEMFKIDNQWKTFTEPKLGW